MSFLCAQDKRNLLAGMLYLQNAEGNLLQVDTPSQILSTQQVCETIRFFLAETCPTCTIRKFTSSQIPSIVWEKERRTNHKSLSRKDGMIISTYREFARTIDGEHLQFVFHTVSGKRTNEIVNETDAADSNSQGEDGQHVTPETYPHRVLFMGLMNEVQMSSKEPNGGVKRYFCKTRKEMLLTSRSQARILHVHWSRFRKDLELRRVSK